MYLFLNYVCFLTVCRHIFMIQIWTKLIILIILCIYNSKILLVEILNSYVNLHYFWAIYKYFKFKFS